MTTNREHPRLQARVWRLSHTDATEPDPFTGHDVPRGRDWVDEPKESTCLL